MSEDSSAQEHFKSLKNVCVPLMGLSKITSSSIPRTITLLGDLMQRVKDIPEERLTPNLISYIFLPLSSILQRNASSELPNQVLEKILRILGMLSASWWWTCDPRIWEQVFMLSGAVIGGIESKGGKGKDRDDETKEAAAFCLYSLVRLRTPEDALKWSLPESEAGRRAEELQKCAQSSKCIPIVGQTLDSLLSTSKAQDLPLQRLSLKVVCRLIDFYLPDPMVPSVLPGIVSTMTRIALGQSSGKGWAAGEIVAEALSVMQVTVIRAIGDEACIKSGAIRRVEELEDLLNLSTPQTQPDATEKIPYGTVRTQSWLKGTASQLHIAINTLTPLVSHPTASALIALATFSAKVIEKTPLSLPQTQPRLLSFLLTLSLSDYPSVSTAARRHLLNLLKPSSLVFSSLQENLMANLGSNLSALPRLLSTQDDKKVAHTAGLIEAVCRLSTDDSTTAPSRLSAVSKGVGKLLGPTGGIEKWGWNLLSVLEIVEPSIVVTHMSSAQLALEADPQAQGIVPFPEVTFRNISSHETREAITGMLHSLGKAGGEAAFYSVEWFFRTGSSSTNTSSVASLWCACRLLEGIADVSLSLGSLLTPIISQRSKRLEKHVKSLAKSVSEIWEQPDPSPLASAPDPKGQDEANDILVQHQKGLVPLHETLKIIHPTRSTRSRRGYQPVVHRALCLHLVSIAAGTLKEKFGPLFIQTLYPILHSLVSPLSFLSATALAALHYVSNATSYASPANLLLSNFDYVLDSVSRRLTQRWLDIDATKVLCIMIRLVGPDIVENAGDVVEECFDRLDEFHGYGMVVDGLVEVLNEVVKAIGMDGGNLPQKKKDPPMTHSRNRKAKLEDFFAFLPKRQNGPEEADTTDYGPAPRESWGKAKVEDAEDEHEEEDDEEAQTNAGPSDEPPPTVIQALTTQIMSRSIYFLTHNSPIIRAKILNLLSNSVPVLPESSLLPSVHSAWPFVLNRLDDSEPFVVAAAAGFVAALAEHAGDYMFRRIWDDIWPKFRKLLGSLEKAESTSALARRRDGKLDPHSAYTQSHRLYHSLMITMGAALQGVEPHEGSFWEVIVAFRRFLGSHVHEELQQDAVRLFQQAGKQNADAVWLAVSSTLSGGGIMEFMSQPKWNIEQNARLVLASLE